MTGCYVPCHSCIDNANHTFAGVQLRNACNKLMKRQGFLEATGQAKITPAFNLPSKYVIHTVDPIIQNQVTDRDRELLARCYRSCLAAADQNHLSSIAFCCISTGEFHFPNDEAARIAATEARHYLADGGTCRIIFNVFKDRDFELYEQLLKIH